MDEKERQAILEARAKRRAEIRKYQISPEEKKARVLKAVNLIMNPNGEEEIKMFTTSHFVNVEFVEQVRRGVLPCEKVHVFKDNHEPDINKRYYFKNLTRNEGYFLIGESYSSIPTRINEKQYMEALDILQDTYEMYMRVTGVELLLVKSPGKINWRVASFQLLGQDQLNPSRYDQCTMVYKGADGFIHAENEADFYNNRRNQSSNENLSTRSQNLNTQIQDPNKRIQQQSNNGNPTPKPSTNTQKQSSNTKGFKGLLKKMGVIE